MILASSESGVARVVLDAPPLNILTRELLAAVRTEITALGRDPTVRVLVLTASGRHFSAGASVEEHLAPAYEDMIPEFAATVLTVRDFPVPVIAGVHGRCLGGGFELVQAADIVIAAENASFGLPEIALGVFPPLACALLPDAPAAAELLYTGDPITAADAAAAGLVRRVVPADRLEDEVLALARRIARHSASALRAAKRARRASATNIDARAEAATRIYLDELMRTHDAVEGLTAFVHKRQPTWSHL